MRFSQSGRLGRRLLLPLLLSVIAPLAMAHASVVEVDVTGVRDTRGHVRVELCTRSTFLTNDCPYQGVAPAHPGATLVRISSVEPGEYAAQAFQDETDEGVVHQNVLGVPRERVGFSNNAPLHVKGPRFSDAAFSVGGEVQRISLQIRHLFSK